MVVVVVVVVVVPFGRVPEYHGADTRTVCPMCVVSWLNTKIKYLYRPVEEGRSERGWGTRQVRPQQLGDERLDCLLTPCVYLSRVFSCEVG